MGYIVLAAIGNEHLLPIAKEEQDSFLEKETIETVDLCRVLDNANETCYHKLIPKTQT